MKDKVAQRERTEALVGGARTFNEFVKEKALANNITPACVRSLPEVKEEWKQIKERQNAEKKAQKLAKTAETKAQKKALAEAKKAEKKATAEAKKATKTANKEVRAEKTAIKKVAKKADENAENIKMILVEKAHKVSKAEKPPQEPKVKGRPKKYATPEEARRAKIEATKVLNKKRKEEQKALKPPKEPKAKKTPAPAPQQRGQQGQPVYVPLRQRKNRTPTGDKIVEEMEREEMGAEDMTDRTKKIRRKRVARQRKETEMMGMEDEDAPAKVDPDVRDAELKVYLAKTIKDLDGVLTALRRAEKKYDRLDPESKRSYNHTLQVYSKKRQQFTKMADDARANIEMFKKAKANASKNKELRREEGEREMMGREDINRAKVRKMLEEGEIDEEEYPPSPPQAYSLIQSAVTTSDKRMRMERDELRREIMEIIVNQPQEDGHYLTHMTADKPPKKSSITKSDIDQIDVDTLAKNFVDGVFNKGKNVAKQRYIDKFEPYEKWFYYYRDDYYTYTADSDREKYGKLGREATAEELAVAKKYYRSYITEKWAVGIEYPDIKPKLRRLYELNQLLDKKGKGFNPDDLKEFKNYGKIQEHLGMHLNDLKEAIDPKDLRDYIHFTKEKARLKSKLVGGLVRTIGGYLSSSESDSDSESDM